MVESCPNACGHHSKLIRNLLAISAQKNLNLSRRSLHTAPKSIRGRLVAYLSDQALRQGTRDFYIPFNRQQLADYLNVDRSALSSELGRMQREGLLTAEKNHFTMSEQSLDDYR
ncbi:Crp/Fnr family transcriptional regulator [Oscillibacter ruminantium]